MKIIDSMITKVMNGERINAEEAIALYYEPLEELCKSADKIRRQHCSDGFDICSIVNGKSGQCSENCKFCAQSSYNKCSTIDQYPLLDTQEIVDQARHNYNNNVQRFSIVTSGKKVTDYELDKICETVNLIVEKVGISVCVSLGLLGQEQYKRLKDAGVTRIHNNLETSPKHFQNVCTTHTFEDKLNSIRAAQAVGLKVCSGGIMGIGETVEDRIDMALELRKLGIESIPVNMLNPIVGTPLESQKTLTRDEMRRIIAVYRFISPKAYIRLAGGRGLLEDKGESCFLSGANAVITGDMLTTEGISIATDLQMIEKLGYKVVCGNE